MRYKPIRTIKFWGGLVLSLIVFGFCFWGINFALTQEDVGLKIVLVLPVIVFTLLFIVMYYGAFTTYYVLNEQGLLINWAFRHIFIPWDEINHVTIVSGDANLFPVFAFSWPGFQVGQYASRGLGAVQMYAGENGGSFIYLETNRGMFGIIPKDLFPLAQEVVLRSNANELEISDMDAIEPEVKGYSLKNDLLYQVMYKLNIFVFLVFALVLAWLFPHSNADNFIIIFLLLALGLLFFCTSIASRVYQFTQNGGYVLLLINFAATVAFFVLSLRQVWAGGGV